MAWILKSVWLFPNDKGENPFFFSFFFFSFLQIRAQHRDPVACATTAKHKSNLQRWNIIWHRQLISQKEWSSEGVAVRYSIIWRRNERNVQERDSFTRNQTHSADSFNETAWSTITSSGGLTCCTEDQWVHRKEEMENIYTHLFYDVSHWVILWCIVIGQLRFWTWWRCFCLSFPRNTRASHITMLPLLISQKIACITPADCIRLHHYSS